MSPKSNIVRDDLPRRIVPISAIRRSRGEVAVIIQYIADLARELNSHSVSVSFLDHLAADIGSGHKSLPAHLISNEVRDGNE